MVAVKYSDLSAAFEFVGSGAPMENNAYLSLDTGKIHWTSELCSIDDAYEAEAGETALREWCAENGIEIIEDRDARG
ncbi:MAG: hypothetical protein ACT4O5_09920 [Gammaproteobacteria bacterium]